MKKCLKVFGLLAAVALVFVACGAMAQGFGGGGGGSGAFSIATRKLVDTFQNVRAVVFIIGGFGLIVLGVGAIFGTVKWKYLAALAAGLAIVAAAGAVVDYVTTPAGGGITSFTGSQLGDTLGGGF